SSPEAQLTIKKYDTSFYHCAGSFNRWASLEEEEKIGEALKNDPKESAKHVMLVDLARNDLSRHCSDVQVKTYKEAQYYSHIIHLVSQVSGRLNGYSDPFEVVGDTFPAGTLSGSPNHMALSLIGSYE